MKASGQLLSGIVRVGINHNGWKTPYEYQCAWSATDPDTVVVHGLVSDGKFNTAHKNAMAEHLASLGFKVCRWIRVTESGRVRDITLKLAPPA